MIKIGVIGAGHLGKIHIRLLKEIPDFFLVGFFDPDPAKSLEIQTQFEIPAFPDAESLISLCDAIDIVTPTLYHHFYAVSGLKKSKHVFIEKPVTATLEEGKELLALEKEAKVKVQIGHVERFNPAFLALEGQELKPMFIECHRLAQWNPRGTDVSVVLDLMIHDLDLIQSVVKSPVKKVSASGVAVLSDTPDIANARIEFNNGCVANLTTSRISMKNMRKIRFFQPNGYVSVDFLDKKTELYLIEDPAAPDPKWEDSMKIPFGSEGHLKNLVIIEPPIPEVNAIRMELETFAAAIREEIPVRVSLSDGVNALETAMTVLDKIQGR
jgi:predicted dehydrogenase